MCCSLIVSLRARRLLYGWWVTPYALYLYCVGLSFRQASRAIHIFTARSDEAVWYCYHRVVGLADAFHVGCAEVAVVDERYVNVKGFGAWA